MMRDETRYRERRGSEQENTTNRALDNAAHWILDGDTEDAKSVD